MGILKINTFTIWTLILNYIASTQPKLPLYVKVGLTSMMCSVIIYGNLLVYDHGRIISQNSGVSYTQNKILNFIIHIILPFYLLNSIGKVDTYQTKYSLLKSCLLTTAIGNIYSGLIPSGITFDYNLSKDKFLNYYTAINFTTIIFNKIFLDVYK